MDQIFVTLEQAAKLENIGYKAMSKRIISNPLEYATTKSPNPDGGRDRVLVSLSSLSKKARRTYKAAQRVAGGDAVIQANTREQEPWYLDVDIHWYIENHSRQYYQAVELAGRVQDFVNYSDKERTAFSEQFAADLGTSQRSLYRYAEKYLEASAWALKLEREDGHSYDHLKVLALCRKPKESGTFPSLSPEQKAFLENVWFDSDFAQNQGTVEMLYEAFEVQALGKGWSIPSYQTVARYIKYLMVEKNYRNAHYLAEKGKRAWMRDVMVKGIRDTSAVPVMGLLQGDAHTFDFWVKYTDPSNGKVSAIRPVLLGWIDTRSRRVMGAIMAKSINGQLVKHSLAKIALEVGMFECILIDNGKEFNNQEITGRKRRERSDHERIEIPLDVETKGFLKSLGVKDDYRSLPYQPWGKGPIERFFLTVCLQFSRWFASYTGTLTASRTAAKVEKNIKKMLEQDKLISLEECYELFQVYLEKYHNKNHRGLKNMGEQWTTPAALFDNAEEHYTHGSPTKDYVAMLLKKTERAWVSSSGIRRFGNRYMDSSLYPHIGSHVSIRWDPDDLTHLIVYDSKGKKVGEAYRQAYLDYFQSQEATATHKRKQNAHYAHDRAILQAATTPYEKRTAAAGAVGKLDLMVENKPQQVIALPEDTQYRQELKDKSKRRGADSSQYLNRRAEEALEKLRKLG